MKENITTGDLIEKLVHQHGIKKKLATELFRAIPEIIEDGLVRDGEVKVKDLGTFRMKWTLARVGRNPKTGERVEIPPHNRLVFLPEQSFKEFINSENRLLSYKVIPDQEHSFSKTILPENEPVNLPEPVTEPIYQDVLQPFPSTLTNEEEIKPAPVRKRRVHWIIPTAIAIIAILCVVFYFRMFYPVGSQQSAVGSQQSIVDSLESIVDSQPVEKLNPQPETRNPKPETRIPEPETRNPEPETRNPEPTPITQPPKSILRSVEGRHLFRMAREEYGNPFLWVLIYRANLDKIPDPDIVVSGCEIIIPALEGTPDKLSRNDSLAVSDGYRLVYEYYQSKGDPRANDFFKGIDRYKPK